AEKFLGEWINNKILLQEEKESFYLHTITFTDPLTLQEKQINLLVALLDLENSKHLIYPHENICEGPVIDRMNLVHHTQANFGCVYILYEDKEYTLEQKVFNRIVDQKPIFEFQFFDNTYHKLFKIDAEGDIKTITDFLTEKDGFIADGHHRYMAALKYYEYRQKENLQPDKAKYRLVSLANVYDRNLLILPTHRIVYKKAIFNSVDEFISLLIKYYEIEEAPPVVNYDSIKKHISEMNKYNMISFLIYLNKYKKLFKLTSRFLTDYNKIISINASNRLKNINTTVLHHLILPCLYGIRVENMKIPEEIDFSKSLVEAVTKCNDDKVDCVIFLSSMKVEDLIFIAKLGEKIPQKTTFFYPKIPSGLTIYKFE
ncbi:MAG: DUF1015 family protein, partial [Planctomycetota bacterium]